MTESLDRMLAYHQDALHYPGAVIRVERAGKVLARKASGALHPGSGMAMPEDALFRIASLTKPVVSVLAMMLVQERVLALDAPINDVLPELKGVVLADGRAPERLPTLRDCLRHTAGFAYLGEHRDAAAREQARALNLDGQFPLMQTRDILAGLAKSPLAVQPGSAFRYGFSTDVVGLAIERATGARLGEVLRERVFGPLGMTQTTFAVADADRERMPTAFAADAGWHNFTAMFTRADALGNPFHSGGGGLVSSVDDYAKFARLLAGSGASGAVQLLAPETFAEMARDQLGDAADGPTGFTGPGFGFGLGLAVRHTWGLAAIPCQPGELTWSGVTGQTLYVSPKDNWFAIKFSCNMASRLLTRFEFRRACATL